MKVFHSLNASWLNKPGYSKRVLADPDQLGESGVLVQDLKIAPGQVAKNHYHKKQTEIFYFLNVVGSFSVNGKKIDLQKGDVLVVEPGDWHEVANESSEDFLYVAFKLRWQENDYFEE